MPDTQTTTQVWRVAPERKLHLRRFEQEQEIVLFDAASGDTHLLNSDAARLLDTLINGPRTFAELQTFPTAEALLRDLAAIGLVQTE